MKVARRAIKKGPYILAETDNINEFILYRKDGKLLDNNVGNLPIEMCQEFICEYGSHIDGNYEASYILSADKICIKVIVKKIVNTRKYIARYS
ncbi:MAG TPA: hypothetical protein PKY25_03265 [Bacilli bacterium]|nr:hypothetical protein [Bacilli bacterium]